MKGGKKKNEDALVRERAKALLDPCKDLIRVLRDYYREDSETCTVLRQPISGNVSALVRLTLALAETLGIIALLNFYISVVKNESFKRHFMEKAGQGTVVTVLSFLAGLALQAILGKFA